MMGPDAVAPKMVVEIVVVLPFGIIEDDDVIHLVASYM